MAGQSLLIPSQALNANSSETLKPYEPGKATGSLDPTLPMPANKDKCGGMGKIIMAVVAVAVAAWAPQFLTQLGATGMFSANGTISALGGAIGGAAGSIASQAVGVAIGAQDKFSWKGVALSALAGGVSGGLPTEMFNTGYQALSTALRMATANALTQGIGVATGLQKKFDWKGVAASAAGGFAGAAVNARLPEGLDPFLGRVVSGFAAGTAAAVARGGRVAIQQVAVDAFGNALGESFVGMMRPTQGVGAYSAGDYTNAMDQASDNAYYDRAIAQSLSGPSSGLTDTSTDAEVMAYRMREAGFDGDMVPTSGNGSRLKLSNGGGKDDLDQQLRDAKGILNMLDRRDAARATANATPAAGLMVDPETGLASFKFTSEQLTAGGGYGVVQDLAPTTANAMRLGLMGADGRSTSDGMSGDQAYSVYMSYGGRGGSHAMTESKWSYSEPNYDLMSSLAGGTGAVLGATDNVGTAIGKSAALSILGRAAPLHTVRIAQIAKAGDLSDAMNVVSSTSKSGQAMAGVANYTKVLGPFGLAASVTEIAADVAGAPVDHRMETFASSTTSAAVGGVAVAGAAKLGAWGGFVLSGGNPVVAFISGAALGGGAALGYEFGGGSNAVKGAVKDGLLDINGKKR